MPDSRHHRGPHPEDLALFASERWPNLREAVVHLSWLLSRGYAPTSSLKLVGDRYELSERQRNAVLRSACSDQARDERQHCQVPLAEQAGRPLDLDGFNLLTSIEAALAGGVILAARDGCYRDMASMHGSYRKVAETRPALILIGEVLEHTGVGACCWYLDRPVSNSGRLKGIIEELAAERRWPWRAILADDVDSLLVQSPATVASADCGLLDRRRRAWLNLAREVIQVRIPDAYVVPLTEIPPASARNP